MSQKVGIIFKFIFTLVNTEKVKMIECTKYYGLISI